MTKCEQVAMPGFKPGSVRRSCAAYYPKKAKKQIKHVHKELQIIVKAANKYQRIT